MTIPTDADLVTIRTQPQHTIGWLSIYNPQIALQAQVNNASITKGARTIAYDSVTSGSYVLVEANFMMLVGTSTGASDKGTIRVRSIVDGTITVAENSDIAWADDDYITILRYVRVEPIFTRIIQNPANETDVIFYKDYDVAYTNQNSLLGAFVNAGCHYAGFLDVNGNCNVYYSASGTSHVIDSVSLTYNWWFEGATTTGSSSHTPGYITYTSPGNYVTRLTVTGNNGSTDTTYRFVRVYDHPSRGTDKPIAAGKWTCSELSGSRSSGMYKTTIRIRDEVDISLIKDNALVVIFTDDFYGYTNTSFGGSSLNRSHIKFVGYIVAGTIEYSTDEKYVEFDVESVTGIMQRCESFSVSVESKTAPTTWYELINMNCKRAIYHYLRWHSTVLSTTDVEFSGTDQNIQYFDADRESLYDAINTLMSSTLVGSVVSDRQGKIWCEVEYKTYSNGGSLPVGPILTRNDLVGKPLISRRESNEVSFMELGGIQYDGPGTGAFTALLCNAPGTAPAYRGKVERAQGLALSSQAQLNTLAGNIFAHSNATYPSTDIKLKGMYTNFDVAPQELVRLTQEAQDNNLGVVWTAKSFAIESCSLQFNHDARWLGVSLDVAEVVAGSDADTVIIPDVPPTDGENGGSTEQPPVNVPPIPVSIPVSTGTSTGGGNLDNIIWLQKTVASASDEDADGFVIFSTTWMDQNNMHGGSSSEIYVNDTGTYMFFVKSDDSEHTSHQARVGISAFDSLNVDLTGGGDFPIAAGSSYQSVSSGFVGSPFAAIIIPKSYTLHGVPKTIAYIKVWVSHYPTIVTLLGYRMTNLVVPMSV